MDLNALAYKHYSRLTPETLPGSGVACQSEAFPLPSIPLPDFGDNRTRRLFSSEMPPGVILSSRELQYTRIRTSLAGRRHMAIEC